MGTNRFDLAAKTWDQDARRVQLAEAITTAMREAVPLAPDAVIMDFGAGTGLITLAFQDRVKTVYAVDTSPGMLAELRAKLRRKSIRNVHPLIWNLAGTDPLPEPLDGIVSAMTFHHLPDVSFALRRLGAQLKPGGRIAIADLEPEPGTFHAHPAGVYHFGFDSETMTRWFKEAGFAEVRGRTIYAMQRPGPDGDPRTYRIGLWTGTWTKHQPSR